MEPFPSLSFRMSSALNSPRFIAVSYTHLDVYKRQKLVLGYTVEGFKEKDNEVRFY